MEFAKLHALGNDFLVAGVGEAAVRAGKLSTLTQQLCDRHRGVGADGVVWYQPTVGDSAADYSALIVNSDGSKAEMSGNGLRCLAAFLRRAALHPGREVRIRTVSGIKTYALQSESGMVFTYESSMGTPITDPKLIPTRLAPGPDPVLNLPMLVGSQQVALTLCSMGNPHCSIFWPDVETMPVDRIGPLLETHRGFPNRTNVEFIQVVDRHTLRVRFWERGVGRTLASGTGSCAAAVASILNNLAESPVVVETELGSMQVRWRLGEELYLTGPAEYIGKGVYEEAGEQS